MQYQTRIELHKMFMKYLSSYSDSEIQLISNLLICFFFFFNYVQKREVVKIHLVKDRGALGIQIAGGKGSRKGDIGIFVAGIDEGSPAQR